MIFGIDHIEIVVKDIHSHVEFYKKLGFRLLTWTDHHGGSAELQLPGSDQPIIEIHEVETEENPGINHISFRCDDIEKTHKELVGKGIDFEHKPHKVKPTGRTNVILRDPDGRRLQITEKIRRDPERKID